MSRPLPRSASALALATVLACTACGGPSASGAAARAPESAPANGGEPAQATAQASVEASPPAAGPDASQQDASQQDASQRRHEEEEPPPASAETRRKGTRTFGWVFLAIGVEATAVAIGTSALMIHAKGSRDDGCDATKKCDASGYDGNEQLRSLAGWNAAAWIVGAAGIGVGAWILVATSPKKETQTAVSVSPNGLHLRSTF